MGLSLCLQCFKGSSSDEYSNPDPAVRRQQLAAAAEQRKKEAEARGIKDPEKVKRQQQRQEAVDAAMEQKGREEGNLQWQVG
ncbi:uncharacterized protein LOC106468243 [Limulus polyphemus]|uniref:Uncharacterized protein LOC106468243 n=1 Tax=Limulus polyphemus TaxID=6850 RepID=A0ABM1BL11_LIMPO|nr:uncharacterized protein LOC106468243 [Limulus polyphemus]